MFRETQLTRRSLLHEGAGGARDKARARTRSRDKARG